MEKRYKKIKITLVFLIILIYSLCCGILIYKEAVSIRAEYYDGIKHKLNLPLNLQQFSGEYNGELVKNVYDINFSATFMPDDNWGFHSMLMDNETGEVLIENQNFLIVRKWEKVSEIHSTSNDFRIILLDETFGLEDSGLKWEVINAGKYSFEIYGECDDVYIYLEKFVWNGTNTYIPDKKQENISYIGDVVKFEDWSGCNIVAPEIGDRYEVTVWGHCIYGDDGSQKKVKRLNEEAEEICKQIYEDYITGGLDNKDIYEDVGLFNCYAGVLGQISEKYAMPFVYVFHPVSIAVEELAVTLVAITIFVIIMIFVMLGIIRKAYYQQLDYESNRRKLTRGIAYELKAPLAITKENLENWDIEQNVQSEVGKENVRIGENGGVDVEDRERTEKKKIMLAEIDHMNKMVSELLELSHFEAGKKQVMSESVDLYALLGTVLKRMKGTIEERNLNIIDSTDKEKAEAGCFIIEADLEMMRTVLANFVSNAVKFAGKDINIRLSNKGRKVKFSIENDGMIVQGDEKDRIWDEFYGSYDESNKRLGGNGLGLSISKQILILHKAKYGCISGLGKTELWFEINS